MKKLTHFAAIALIVAGSIACKETNTHEQTPADPAAASAPADNSGAAPAVSSDPAAAPTDMNTTTATAPATQPPAGTTDPSATTTDAAGTQTPSTTTTP